MAVQISGNDITVPRDTTVTRNLTVGGVLTYEDVTNVDSIGIVTARAGVLVGSGITLSKDGDIFATGVTTATTFSGSGANLTNLPAANLTGILPAISGANLTNLPSQLSTSNMSDNRVVTSSGGVVFNGESSLTFDGTRLNVGGTGVSQTRTVNIGSDSEANLAIETHNTSASETANIRFYRSRGTAASPTTLVDNDVISSLLFYGYDGTDYAHSAAMIRVECDGTVAGNQMPGLISFHTNSGTTSASERLRITSDGKVCINNDNAFSDLHVCTTGSSEQDGTLRLGGSSTDLGFVLEYDQSSATTAKITSNPTYTNTSALLKICVDGDANANQLVLKGDGNIGINRSDPDRELCVNGVAEFNSYDNTGGGGSYYTDKGFMIGNAYDAGKASSVTDDRNAIVWNERGLDIDFATADALRMKINYQGDVFFNGMTSLTASSTNKGIVAENSSNNGRMNFHANSSAGTASGVLFYHSGSHVGGINYTSSATIYNTSSDYRLKENATAISDGITRLKTLKPYRFNFKIDPSKTVDGFFAHEVTTVPEAITGTKDEVDSDNNPVYQQIDQSKLVPLLTAALQEAITEIETLKSRLDAAGL